MPATRLKEFLDKHDTPYIVIKHSPAYTAQGIAHMAHISGKVLAKTVILRVDGQLSMAVVHANQRIDTEILRGAIGARTVELAAEEDFAEAFPGCEVGAMPPFGNLWNIPVYVAEQLTADEHIAFNAGTHTELVQMTYADFARLVKPRVVPLTPALV